MSRKQWQPGDPETCEYCVWGSETVGSRATGGGVTCFLEPITAEKNNNHFCRHWASTRGLSSEQVDKDRLPLERLRKLVIKAASLLTEESLPPMRKGTHLDSWRKVRNNWIEAYNKEEIEKSDYIKG